MKVYKATNFDRSALLSIPSWLSAKYEVGVKCKPIHPDLPFWAYRTEADLLGEWGYRQHRLWEYEAEETSEEVWIISTYTLKDVRTPEDIETIWRLERDEPYSFDFTTKRCNPDIVFCSEITLLKEITR